MGSRLRRLAAVAVALASLLAPTGCAAGGSAPATAPHPLCAGPRAARLDCGMYTAVRAERAGQEAAWLPTMPIRLWFEPLNGRRTAIIDAPVNTYNVPGTGGSLLWTGEDGSATAVGCFRGCDADGFVGAITQAPARDRVAADGAITIIAADRTVVFEPTAAPVRPRSCDVDSIDELPCTRLVSVGASDDGAWIGPLRSEPVSARLSGRRGHHVVTVRASDGAVWTLHPVDGRAGLVSAGTRPAVAGGVSRTTAFLTSLFAGRVVWRPHFSSVLLTGRGRTLQLEGAD